MLLKLYHHYRVQLVNYTEHDKQLYQHYEAELEDRHDMILDAKFHALMKKRKQFFIINKDRFTYEVDLYYKLLMFRN
jgi:hypothetical protein